jgi:Protein of unknown function (DUF1580)
LFTEDVHDRHDCRATYSPPQDSRRSNPRTGDKPVHPDTLHRWCLLGVRGIRLESVMVGGRRCTSIEALNRFFQAVTAAANGDRQPMAGGSRARREQAGAVQEDVAWQKEQGA